MNLPDVAGVGLAASFGAAARFWVDGVVRARTDARLPLGTMVINLTGSLLLGVLTGLVVYHHASTNLTLLAGTGFCGGYTTFSTASFETVRLIQNGDGRAAAASLAVTVVGTLALAAAGLALASL